MMRRLLTALALLLLAVSVSEAGRGRNKHGGGPVAVPPPPPPPGSCTGDYYASPQGGGSGTDAAHPFLISQFWALAVQGGVGKKLCLADGIYTGASSMITPPANLSGSAGSPITISGTTEGGALVDGEFQRYPLHLTGNSWFVFEGFNGRNGTLAVFNNDTGSNNNVYRRLVGWDTDVRLNTSIFYNITAQNTLLEDVGLFGAGTALTQNIGSNAQLTLRRVWGRWEGSTVNSTKEGLGLLYSTGPTRGICENCLATGSNLALPTTWFLTNLDGSATTTQVNRSSFTFPEGLIRIRSDVGATAVREARILGSLAYLLQGDVWPGNSGIKIPTGGAEVNGVQMKHSASYTHPLNNQYASLIGFNLSGTTGTNTADRITRVGAGADTAPSNPPWTVTNKVTATNGTLAAVQTALNSANANPYTGSAGAQFCFQWVNQAVTATPLWPWPMRQRIIDATTIAGTYSGPVTCPAPGCSGFQNRPATDVQADIESLLGTIPAGCKS